MYEYVRICTNMYEYVRICTNAYEYVRIKFFIFNINQIDNAKIVPWLNH